MLIPSKDFIKNVASQTGMAANTCRNYLNRAGVEPDERRAGKRWIECWWDDSREAEAVAAVNAQRKRGN